MQHKPKKDRFGDLIVEASLEEIQKGARRIIGPRIKVTDGKNGVRIFSDDTETCPLEVIATPIGKRLFRLDVGSKCTIKNCDYFGECARLDARAAKSLEHAMAEVLGHSVAAPEGRIWTPERLRDDEKLRKVINRLIDEGT